MKKIVVVGVTGSGKSHVGDVLARAIDGTHVELDALFWEEGWGRPSPEVFRARVEEALRHPRWVATGNYSLQRDVSWPEADTVVWLDFPLSVVIPRLVRRTLRRWYTQELLWGKNRQSLLPMFRLWDPHSSLLTYAVVSRRAQRISYEREMQDPRWKHLRFVRLRSPEEVQRWLGSIGIPSGQTDFQQRGLER